MGTKVKQEIVLGIKNDWYYIEKQTGIDLGCGNVCPSLNIHSTCEPDVNYNDHRIHVRGRFSSCDLNRFIHIDGINTPDIIDIINVFNSGKIDNDKIINIIKMDEDDSIGKSVYKLYTAKDTMLYGCDCNIYDCIAGRVTLLYDASLVDYDISKSIPVNSVFSPAEVHVSKEKEKEFLRKVSIINALWKRR